MSDAWQPARAAVPSGSPPASLPRGCATSWPSSGTAQERLDRIVRIIAADMVAEVCSAYVMRAGEVLELFATEGLQPEAVHRTRLRVGEGLVGDIAATPGRWRWPTRSPIPISPIGPETGEEIYHSLMGVPILRGGRVLGVLVVQNRTLRHYTEDEIEALQTIAMVVAELVASGELVNPHEIADSRGSAPRCRCGSTASRLNAGPRASGRAVLHEPRRRHPPGRRRGRRGRARAAARRGRRRCSSAIDELVARAPRRGAGEHRDVLESLSHVRRRPRLARAHRRRDAQRPHRRGRGAEGAATTPRAA